MTVFIEDTSEQSTATISSNPRYTTIASPNTSFNGTTGIYNPSLDTIKIFTNNTDAFTIDNNQCIFGNGTGLTNIGYSNVINKPTYFQSDWNNTISNKPDLTVYATVVNLNSFSTSGQLSIYNLTFFEL